MRGCNLMRLTVLSMVMPKARANAMKNVMSSAELGTSQ
jgi:hypothetical protein